MKKKSKAWKNSLMNEKEYSKKWMDTWQFFVMFWCSIFFITDIFFNQAEHCVELCICLVTSVAATFVVYLPKAYFGKRNEEENKIIQQGLENEALDLEFVDDCK